MMKRSALHGPSKREVLPLEAMLRDALNRDVFCIRCFMFLCSVLQSFALHSFRRKRIFAKTCQPSVFASKPLLYNDLSG